MSHAGMDVPVPAAAQFLASNRGGGLFSEAISQRIGSYLAVAALRLGLAPTVLTLVGLALGVGASAGVALLAPDIGPGQSVWPVGLAALVIWHLAYSFDCADGQLARVTKRASPAGGRVDLLCDLAVQISLVTAVSAVAVSAAESTPSWLIAVFAGTWLVNLITSVMASGPAAASLLTSRSIVVRIAKLVRDYGAMLTVCGLAITFAPAWTPWVMAGFSLTNGSFLVLSIIQAAVAAFRADGTLAVPQDSGE